MKKKRSKKSRSQRQTETIYIYDDDDDDDFIISICTPQKNGEIEGFTWGNETWGTWGFDLYMRTRERYYYYYYYCTRQGVSPKLLHIFIFLGEVHRSEQLSTYT